MPETDPTFETYSPADWLVNMAKKCDLNHIGITPGSPSPNEKYIRLWLDEGKHGEMAYLANHLDIRLDPNRLLQSEDHQAKKTACTVITVMERYANPADDELIPSSNVELRIARYGLGGDYHKKLKKKLFNLTDALREQFSDSDFRATVDTAPILEREHAAKAGLGWIGKHTLLIHPQMGSYFFLGMIVCNVSVDQLSSDQLQNIDAKTPFPDSHCGTCTRCIDACPTDCIDADGYQMDASKCISYLTLEHRTEIPASLKTQMLNWLAGCDICQEVCPYNQTDRLIRMRVPLEHDYPQNHELLLLDPLEIIQWTEEDRRQQLKGSALKRMKLPMIRRNALIAVGNQISELSIKKRETLKGVALAITKNDREDPIVIDAAKFVLALLN